MQALRSAPGAEVAEAAAEGEELSQVRLDLLRHVTKIVASYAKNNALSAVELPEVIISVADCLSRLQAGGDGAAAKPEPAVPVKRSVRPDYIVCLEDGKKLKMLKRHLKTQYAMTPDEYRARWGLAPDYPMVAPNYAKKRSQLAKKIGLGKKSSR